MALGITIGGANKSAHLDSIRWADALNGRNTLDFVLHVRDGSYRPRVGEEVVFSQDGTRRFLGTIETVREAKLGPGVALRFDLSCVSRDQVCDRHLVAKAYETPDQTLRDVVLDIVATDLAGEGITTTAASVETGPVLGKVIFDYVTVAAAFNELSQRTGMSWWIDEQSVLHFRFRESVVAPFDVTASNRKALHMAVTETREQYRNRQVVRAGHDLTISRTERWKGDGSTRVFVLQFPAGTQPTEVEVNGVSKTIGIGQVETGKDFYWNKGSNEIRQDDAGTVLTASDELAVTYQGLFPIIVQAQSDNEIAARMSVEGGTGVYEVIEDRREIDDADLALDAAVAHIRRYGRIPRSVEVETDAGGLRAGQLIHIVVPEHNLNGQFLIESIEARDVSGAWLRYTATCLDGEAIGGWIAFFQKLAAAGRQFVVRDNEVLLILRVFPEAVVCGDTLTVSSGAPESKIGTLQVGFGEIAA
jgi:hypothetical protein